MGNETTIKQGVRPGGGHDAPFHDPRPPARRPSVESWDTVARSLGLTAPRRSPAPPARSFISGYLSAAAAVCFLAGLGVFALNALVDPLWYLGGNVLAPQNFIFNERLAKTNLLLADGPASYERFVKLFGPGA